MSEIKLTDFGKKVKIRLIEMNMTQVELADYLKISKQYLHRILSGDRSGTKYINKIKKLLQIEEDIAA